MSLSDTCSGTQLSVIVPAYNSAQTLPRCLTALGEARKPLDLSEVIVVDDGSTDGTAAIASEYGALVLRAPRNRGPGAARNLGATQAHGQVLVFVDADVEIADDALMRIARYFDRDSTTVALIGSYDHSPDGTNLVSVYRNLLHHFVHQQGSRHASHFWTGLGAIQRSLFQAIGGFDEQEYGRSIEDVELGYRLRTGGYDITMDTAIQCKHLKRWTLVSMVRTDLFTRAIPWTRLLIKYRQVPNDFSLGTAQKVSVFVSGMVCLFAAGSVLQRNLLLPAILSLCIFVIVNFPFIRYFSKRQGFLKGIASVPLHLLYNVNAGLGLLLGLMSFSSRYLFKKLAHIFD